MKKVVIAGSGSLEEKAKYWKTYFEKRGNQVMDYPIKLEEVDKQTYANTYLTFYNHLKQADLLFVMNEDKKGIEGYIGAETFAELSYALTRNLIHKEEKQIILLKMPSKQVQSYEEIQYFLELGWIELLKQ